MIVTFCGHADFLKQAEYEEQMLDFLTVNIGNQAADFYLGGYGNFDDFAYDCCRKYQKTHPKVSLVFVTPYLIVKKSNDPLEHCGRRYDAVLYPEIENKPMKFAIYYRNRWMVDKADYLICGIEHSWGGAYTTYQYAKSQGKTIWNVLESKN